MNPNKIKCKYKYKKSLAPNILIAAILSQFSPSEIQNYQCGYIEETSPALFLWLCSHKQ